jgi:hypothetical protein
MGCASEINAQNPPMKSAYELAMERLEKSSPSAPLTDSQKAEIAEIDSTFRAKIAEREVFLNDLIAKAEAEGKPEEVAELQAQRTRELARLRADCEAKKEKIRAPQNP